MNKEKIILYIEDLENKAKQSDKYFIERNELFIENQQLKDRIDKAIKHISKEFLCYDNESDEHIQRLKAIEILKGENND